MSTNGILFLIGCLLLLIAFMFWLVDAMDRRTARKAREAFKASCRAKSPYKGDEL